MKTITLIIFTSFLVIGFISLKAQEIEPVNSNEVINIAILDFIKTNGLYKKDSVFSVSFNDTAYRMVLEKNDNENSKWVKGELNNEVATVTIISSYYQFSLVKEANVGSKGLLPSRFIEKKGNLFYWYDDDYPLTEETLGILREYGILRDDPDGILYLDNVIDDSKKAMHYYFCKNNLLKYKKVKTRAAIGYYKPPNISCSKIK